jgi:murein DD-endopeptidase MepM/ murein hydrolase activator NlpD
MLELWRGMSVLKGRLREARRAARRMGQLRREIEHRVRHLQIALTHLFRVCPVDEPRSYVDDFGVLMRRDENGVPTTDKKKWHRHRGVDIFSVAGTPVRAPFSGWARVATNSVGGLAVKVFGAQGFVYNAHLTAYGHLGYVEEDTIIGYVGNSGDARGTMAHDHFEWHPGNGPAVNPYPFLNEACQ